LKNGAGEGGFAAAGFADEPEDFTAAYGEINAVDGFDGADVPLHQKSPRNREVGFDVVELENGFGHFFRSRFDARSATG
jgi:hypothetical protein